jgi:hypothetical protein
MRGLVTHIPVFFAGKDPSKSRHGGTEDTEISSSAEAAGIRALVCVLRVSVVILASGPQRNTWMPATSAGMTSLGVETRLSLMHRPRPSAGMIRIRF